MDELSTLSVAAADAAAGTARAASAGIADVEARVSSAVTSLGGWYGAARDGYAERVVELQAQLATLAFTAVAGAALIEEHARVLGMLKARLARIDAELAAVQARVDAGVGDLVQFQSDWGELERWQASRRALLAEFDAESASYATRMFALVDQVPQRPRRFGEHVDDAARTVVTAGSDAAFLAGGWAWDPQGWASTWKQAPGAAAESAKDPVGSLADAVAWDDFADGRYGAGLGSLGAAFLAGRIGTGLDGGRAAGKILPDGHRWAKYLDDDGHPLPQSVDDLFAGVDLARSEVFASAHTLGRHVEVDDEFLKQRLETGRLEDGRTAKNPPVLASRFADQETAESVVTAALRLRQDEVYAAIDNGQDWASITAPAPADAGVIWTKDGQGGYVMVPVTKVQVRLLEAADGSWYVHTAYLDGE